MTELSTLVARIEAFIERTGAARSTVSRKLLGNGRRLDEIKAGGSLTERKMTEAMNMLDNMERERSGKNAGGFFSLHRHNMVRVATSTPRVLTADVAFNRDAIIEEALRADAARVDLLVYPELCLSSYALDDLHMQAALLDAVEQAIGTIAERTADLSPVLLIGAPLRRNGRLYNCALAISR